MEINPNMQISEKTLEIVKNNPTVLGMLKGGNLITLEGQTDVGYDEIQKDNGVFLYYRQTTNTYIFLHRDLTFERANEVSKMYDNSVFFTNDQLRQDQIEYLEEWRKRDEVSEPFQKKLNTILYKPL